MRHFAAYHNSKKMGYSAFSDKEPFGIYTSRNFGDLAGDLVWVMTRYDNTSETDETYYCLSSWFEVNEVIQSDDSNFNWKVKGIRGGALDPVVVLNDLDWFPEFFRKSAHFSVGFHEIRDEPTIASLISLAAEGNCPL